MTHDQILAVLPAVAEARAEGRTQPKSPRRPQHGDQVAIVELVGFIDRIKAAAVAERLYRLANSQSVCQICLVIDSPGGQFIAASQLAEVVMDARAQVSVVSYVDGMCASGALYVAAATQSITASRQSLIGSIGTIIVLVDSSKAFERFGLKVIPIATGRFKQTGVPGTQVTSDEIDELRQLIGGMNEQFLADLARGRKLSPAYVRDELATGAMWGAYQALDRKLIDRIERWNDFAKHLMPVKATPNVASYRALFGKTQRLPNSFC